MRAYVREYKKHPAIRQLALRVTDDIGAAPGRKNFLAEVRAIHDFVSRQIRYVKDVNGVETLATPLKTLEFRAGDCDDQATLVATLLETLGHPTRFVAIKMKPFGPYVHVFTETKVGRRWLPVETTENWPVGFHPPKFAGRLVRNN